MINHFSSIGAKPLPKPIMASLLTYWRTYALLGLNVLVMHYSFTHLQITKSYHNQTIPFIFHIWSVVFKCDVIYVMYVIYVNINNSFELRKFYYASQCDIPTECFKW